MGFTCSNCQSIHEHPRSKHHLEKLDSISDDYIEQMSCDPACGCGWDEARHDLRRGNLELSEEDEKAMFASDYSMPEGI